MKKNVFYIVAIGIFLLTACGGTPPTDIPINSSAATETATTSDITPLPFPSRTPRERPNEPTVTPLPPTPLPTIPTFTPTFDVRTIVTITPAARAECPEENDRVLLNVHLPQDVAGSIEFDHEENIESFKDFLNAGGAISAIVNELQQAEWIYEFRDFSGDAIPELIFIDPKIVPIFRAFYCQNRQYKLFTLIPTHEVEMDVNVTRFTTTSDLNLNDLPDFIWLVGGCSSLGCFKVFTMEWNGSTFTDLSPDAQIFGLESIDIRDIDKNGTKEIILKGDQPGMGIYDLMLPWRFKTSTYTWDGQEYTLASEYFAPPQFRFQAVQDADRYILEKNYNNALLMYQNVIFDKTLDWWSPEKRNYYVYNYFAPQITATPDPTLNPDQTEYPRLAAYAYYRIMLLHIVQGHESDAGTVYKTLQQRFSNDPHGRPYSEMASAFWDAYQSTRETYDGCAAAIQYAAEHPEILIPLGSDYHGSQSHIYVPADVCPFR